MTSDAQDSHRKHRGASSDDEEAVEKSSKRHKHRHHRRHHRHRHGSKKREEETKAVVDDVEAPPPPPVELYDSGVNGSMPVEDVEEGEILDEEGVGGRDDGVSNAESGEIETPGVGDHSNKRNLRDNNINKNTKTVGHLHDDDDDDDDARGRVGGKSRNEAGLPRDSRRHRESGSPSRGSDKRKNYFDDEKVYEDGSKSANRKKLSSGSSGDKYNTLVRSPSCDRRGDELHGRGRSRSYDRLRERSRSRSIIEEESLSKRRHYHERDTSVYVEKSKAVHGSDDEGLTPGIDSVDLRRDDEREHNISYSRYSGLGHSRERERSREREVGQEQRREKDQERIRDNERRREKERERSSDRDLVRDRKRGIGREHSRERVIYMERRREERHRSRDIENRDRNRDDSNRSRDRVKDDRDRNMERGRDRAKDTDRKWERRDDRDRDRGRDMEREKYEHHEDSYGNRDRHKSARSRHNGKGYDQDRRSKTDPAKVQSPKNYSVEGDEDMLERDEDEEESIQVAGQEEDDVDRIKEESRRIKQAILEKYKSQQSQQTKELRLQEQTESQLQKQFEPQPLEQSVDKGSADHLEQSAASVKPGLETDDGRSDGDVSVAAFSVSPQQNGADTSRMPSGATGLGEGTPESEGAVAVDDIFGETPVGVQKLGKGDRVQIERSGLHDNWDDAEGYYSYRFGELLDARYEITAAHGKGVFSTVVRAKNLTVGNGEPEEVAIKMIRSNDTMLKAGMTELTILKKLAGHDPDNKRHCVRFLSNFKYRNHLCLVFESLHMNLREVLKKFGRNIGLKLTGVREYAKQLFIALKHLKNCGVLHCDIKPDNMLVNESKNVLKLCDFGNAMFAGKNEVTPYLVSRFYRAPEIILGLPYDHPLDIWSVGCCLYELYTGKVLFPGATNNDMLRLHMELKGPFPKKMLRKGAFTHQHFDQDLNFHATEDDPVTKKAINRVIFNIKLKDIGSLITGSGENAKMLADFKDLLDKMFVLDPDKRLTVSQALNHPFITVLAWLKSEGVMFWSGVLITGGGSFTCTVSIVRQLAKGVFSPCNHLWLANVKIIYFRYNFPS
ncbi:hypothetical protein ACFX2C_020699 [Malus domestica]